MKAIIAICLLSILVTTQACDMEKFKEFLISRSDARLKYDLLIIQSYLFKKLNVDFDNSYMYPYLNNLEIESVKKTLLFMVERNQDFCDEEFYISIAGKTKEFFLETEDINVLHEIENKKSALEFTFEKKKFDYSNILKQMNLTELKIMALALQELDKFKQGVPSNLLGGEVSLYGWDEEDYKSYISRIGNKYNLDERLLFNTVAEYAEQNKF
jgi:hypothetical protein